MHKYSHKIRFSEWYENLFPITPKTIFLFRKKYFMTVYSFFTLKKTQNKLFKSLNAIFMDFLIWNKKMNIDLIRHWN